MSEQDRPRDKPDKELSALWRDAAAADVPPPTLDAAILAASRAAVAAPPRLRRRPWWARFALPVSVAAIAVIGLSVTLRVADEDERRMRQEYPRNAEPSAAPSAPAKPAEVAAPVVGSVGDTAQSPSGGARRREAVTPRPFPNVVPAQPETRAPNSAPAAAVPSPLQDRAAKEAEMSGAATAKKADDAAGQRRRAEVASEAGASSPAAAMAPPKAELAPPMPAAPAAPAARKALRADSEVGGDLAKTLAPEVWLARIRELRDAGNIAEAAANLRRFRAAYPAFELPEDLARDERLSGAR